MSDSPAIRYHTFGCKANQYDTERMRLEIEGRGAATASSSGSAHAVVINTCTVTNRADAEARKLIRRVRRRDPQVKIVVAGCSAATRQIDYRAMPEVDRVVPGQDPERVARALVDLGLIGETPIAGPRGPRQARGTRAWLKIQDGCDRKCSFCATRLARGVSRSRPPEELVGEARRLARFHPEIVLTGIHIGHYGRDLEPETTLGALCARLLEAVPSRIRLSSIEATEIEDPLVDLMCESAGQLAPHLHVPLQSGSDRVLRLMRRWHTRAAYGRRVLEIAERVWPLGLGADVIVGFPGEGAREFAETRALIEALPYTYLHVFPFSARDGTVAASLPAAVRGDVRARRSRELRELALAKGADYERRRAGLPADVVVEGEGEGATGITGDYLRVALRGGTAAPGTRFVAVLCEAEGRLSVRVPPPS